LFAQSASGRISLERLQSGAELLDHSGIGIPLWVLLFGLYAWGGLLVVLGYTALMAHVLERRSVADLGLGLRRRVGGGLAGGLPVSGMDVPATVVHTATRGTVSWTGGTYGPEAGLLLCVLLVIHTCALWAMKAMVKRSVFGVQGSVEG